MSERIRLDKAVAHNFAVSRQEAAALIKQGRIRVDGQLLTEVAGKIPLTATLSFDGEQTSVQQGFARRYFMLNKPQGMVCADHDRDYPVVLNLFYEQSRWTELHCVGRLDQDTTGLLLVTDDGDFIHQVTSPKQKIPKLYRAVVAADLQEHDVLLCARGLKHPEEKKRYAPAQLALVAPREALITVTEGRFHEVKRIFECLHNQVLELRREQIGGLHLDETLEEGQYRPLTQSEVAAVFS